MEQAQNKKGLQKKIASDNLKKYLIIVEED